MELTEFLRETGSAQALRIDPKKHSASVATLGPVDIADLEYRLSETLAGLEPVLAQLRSHPLEGIAPFKITHSKDGILIEKPTCETAPHLWHWRDINWPESAEEAERHGLRLCKQLAALTLTCAGAGITGCLLQHFEYGPRALMLGFYLIALIAGAWNPMRDVLQKLPKGQLDIDFLMLAVALGSSAIGAFTEGILLLFLFSASETMEHFALYQTRKGIDSLFKNTPKQAIKILPDGTERTVKVSEIAPQDHLRIRPGDIIPVDARVLSGQSATDESSLSGESIPVEKSVGDALHSGTLNLWGVLEVIAIRKASESALQKIIRLIREAQHLKAPSQRFTDRFGNRYTQIILSATFLMFLVWWLGMGLPAFSRETGPSAFYRAMTLLVVASPCALVLSIPSAILAAIAWGARHGILFRGGAAIEKLCETTCVALDKTGTLTTGELAVESIESFPTGQEATVAAIAFNLEKNLTHPIARAIATYGRKHALDEQPTENIRSLTGLGVEGQVGGVRYVLGKRALMENGPLKEWASALPVPNADHSEVWVLGSSLIGRLLLRDEVRTASKAVLESLHQKNIKTVMLTGDNDQTAQSIGQLVGVGQVRAQLRPEDKVRAIQQLHNEGNTVAMIGDGVNDAPSLAAADISVAMGARGSDAALEQAQVILMNDRIENFLAALNLSKRAKRIIVQNLALSLGTIAIMVTCALMGWVPLALGVTAHEGSTVLVCLNSLRLLRSSYGVTPP